MFNPVVSVLAFFLGIGVVFVGFVGGLWFVLVVSAVLAVLAVFAVAVQQNILPAG